ncbi:hypothetical protein BN2537_11161 [Streptomyces venezuelae]|nr:hypothetical protein BN2537_11161 [Streptomyces venezuelae]
MVRSCGAVSLSVSCCHVRHKGADTASGVRDGPPYDPRRSAASPFGPQCRTSGPA